jgi:hypothetical protein
MLAHSARALAPASATRDVCGIEIVPWASHLLWPTVFDPEYLARVPKRNETFNMPEARRFLVRPLVAGG